MTWACARDIVRVGVGLWLATATGGHAAPQELAGMRGKQYSGGGCSFEWPDLSVSKCSRVSSPVSSFLFI